VSIVPVGIPIRRYRRSGSGSVVPLRYCLCLLSIQFQLIRMVLFSDMVSPGSARACGLGRFVPDANPHPR
jgi:hypothetical protein